ncbi:GAF domain-containing protein [Mumia flava]|uniref:GAF domain-containing protein n=1 Tax=Mumia flava TaxID=1348852 RepID=A0A2M9BDV6_9ACTN|nr:GAF and ANTAR domain-containing protein [Mumia flava]PJJ56140.1 GAF domain-containing protein [Mumia flava]
MATEHELAARFAALGRQLFREDDAVPTVERVVQLAIELVPACDDCGLMLRRRRATVVTASASSPRGERCDNLQYQLDEGPCLEAIWEDESYLSGDLENDPRWRRWGPAAAAEGIHSVLSIRLVSDDETIGSLNLYAEEYDAFSADDVDTALIFASHATLAMSSARLVTGLRTAMQSRHLIGIAQGILVARYEIDVESAFDVLRRCSNDTNIRLSDIAAQVVAAGALPPDLLDRSLAQETGRRGHDSPDPP